MVETEPSTTSRSGPPLDPRLLRYSSAGRAYVIVTAVFAIATVIAIIVAAAMTASILSEIIADPSRRTVAAQAGHLWVLAGALLARVLMTFGHDRYAHRASARVIAQLRSAALDSITDPRRTSTRTLLAERERASTVLLRGLDALAPYLSGYVPALIVSVIVTPVVIAVIAVTDWPSALIIVITIPLIPLFMILVGLMTRDRTSRKLETMSRLSAQLLDLIAGLPTLRALNRAEEPARRIGELGQQHRRSTMSALRVAFLSGAVLELLATLCVALIAVGIGVRLVYGDMSLYAGVLALILAPEAYLPLRQVGAQFHNSTDGMVAARAAFELIEHDDEVPVAASSAPVSVAGQPITIDGLGVRGRDGWAPRGLDATIAPAALTMLTGPNGSGKSTTVSVILGLLAADEGRVRIGDVDVRDADPDDLHRQLAWLPQQPVVVPGTIADNLALFGDLDPAALRHAASATGFDEVLETLPEGMATAVGAGGVGLSAGQRQRLALTRVLASPAPLVLLDEPTAHLDVGAATEVLRRLRERARAGDTVVIIAHRPETLEFADQVIEFERAGAGAGDAIGRVAGGGVARGSEVRVAH